MIGRRAFMAAAGGALAGASLVALGGCTQGGGPQGRGSAGPGAKGAAQGLRGPDVHECDALPAGTALWDILARDVAADEAGIWSVFGSSLFAVNAQGRAEEACGFGHAQALRVAADGACVCVALDDGTVACVDASAPQQVRWTASGIDTALSAQTAVTDDGSTPTWASIPLLMDGDTVYALFSSSAYEPCAWMAAFALEDGGVAWRQPLSYAAQNVNGVVGDWTLADGAILTTTGAGIVDALDPHTGETLGTIEGDGWVVGGIAPRADGGYLLQMADGTLLSFAFADGSFEDVTMRRLTDAAPTVDGIHNTRPIDLGGAFICRVPADTYEEPADGSAARMKMTLGVVDAETFEILDRLDDMDPQRQPVVLESDEGTELFVAANNLMYRVELDGTSFGDPESLGISVLDSDGMMYPEPTWWADAPALLVATDADTVTAIG